MGRTAEIPICQGSSPLRRSSRENQGCLLLSLSHFLYFPPFQPGPQLQGHQGWCPQVGASSQSAFPENRPGNSARAHSGACGELPRYAGEIGTGEVRHSTHGPSATHPLSTHFIPSWHCQGAHLPGHGSGSALPPPHSAKGVTSLPLRGHHLDSHRLQLHKHFQMQSFCN